MKRYVLIDRLLFSTIKFPSNCPGHNYIGSEHLLLGLIREEDGVAAIVLKNFQVDIGNIRSEVNLHENC